jgi:ABC-type amino acid transport system permease subunit
VPETHPAPPGTLISVPSLDTLLASIIGFTDLAKAAQVVNNRKIRPFPSGLA